MSTATPSQRRVLSGAALSIALSYSTAAGPYVPASVEYQILDVLSGQVVLPWTELEPQASAVIVSGSDNALLYRPALEERLAAFKATTASGGVQIFRCCWTVVAAQCGC